MKSPAFTFPKSLRQAALGLLLAAAGAAQAQTTTFTFTGGPRTYQVPAGVTRLRIDAQGASGGTSYQTTTASFGARVLATIPVVPGEILTVVVGGRGTTGDGNDNRVNAGGFNGGGYGTGYGGGGGATDLRRAAASPSTGDYLGTRNALLVAGGAGGSFNGGSAVGGAGGTPNGGTGTSVYVSPTYFSGVGATQTGPGAAGAPNAATAPAPGRNNEGGNTPFGSGGVCSQ